MPELKEIDKNVEVKTDIAQKDCKWFEVNKNNFEIFGFTSEKDIFCRMNSDVAKAASDGVYALHRMASGGRICFETNSDYVAVKLKGNIPLISLMGLLGTGGMDLYIDEGDGFIFYAPFVPLEGSTTGYESIVKFDISGDKKLLIHLPLYTAIDKLEIGVSEKSYIKKLNPYKKQKPLVFYGSSITHGGCASRPGNIYPAIISRKLNLDFINLGFPGNAHGEQIMAEYISKLPMSAFIMDYDQNDSETPELLKERHYSFYETVRKNNPDLPIILMSAPYSRYFEKIYSVSREVVTETYKKAESKGDNVYFVDGKDIFGKWTDCAFVDICHPNDYGFVKMAEAVMKVLRDIF